MASIQDVANRAQVGIATVSRVLSGKGYVADTTRERVLNAINELNYVPNELARNLLHNRTKTIAVIVPDMLNPFFASLVNEMETSLRHAGYQTLLCNTIGEPKTELVYLNMLERNMVDGIITASHLLHAGKYERIKRPIVGIDRVLGRNIPTVCSDHAEGGRRAAELLIKAGCKNVAQFRDGIDEVLQQTLDAEPCEEGELKDYPFLLRHTEFERVIREAGIGYREFKTTLEGHFINSGHLNQFVYLNYSKFEGVDGVLATDCPALMLRRVVLENGKSIPQDIKIVSYDGTYLMDFCYPAFSFIAQPITEIARKAVELLLKQINGEKIENMREILPIKVINSQPDDSICQMDEHTGAQSAAHTERRYIYEKTGKSAGL